jgi:hypothetical protein
MNQQLARVNADDEKHADAESAVGVLHNPLPSYNPEVAPGLRIRPRLEPVVSECRAIISRVRGD